MYDKSVLYSVKKLLKNTVHECTGCGFLLPARMEIKHNIMHWYIAPCTHCSNEGDHEKRKDSKLPD